MSIECGCDPEWFIELPDNEVTSQGTEFCHECGHLIQAGTGHFIAWKWNFNEDWAEVHMGKNVLCFDCWGLAVTWLELGYCWTPRVLRSDIATLHGEGLL